MAREKSDSSRLSRNILDRVRADSEGYLHPRDRKEAPADDWPEVWGRRIGRSLGAVFVIVLVIWLYNFLTRAG